MSTQQSATRSAMQETTVAAGPLFIVGCGCSGTTLLRLMLTSHPDLAIPYESHFMYEVMRGRARGIWPTDLTDAVTWLHLLAFILRHPRLQRWGFDREALFKRLQQLTERSYRDAFQAVFDEFRAQQGKTRWGDKTPQHVQYMLVLSQLFPEAKFIHLIRDGRDVAMSLVALELRTWGPRYMALAGYYWAWLVLSGVIGGAVLGPSRYLEVRYEDLVLAPEATLQALCDWAGLTFTKDMLHYYATPTAQQHVQRIAPRKQRLIQPPDASRVKRWMREMAARDQQRIVRQVGAVLSYLGYPVGKLPRRQRQTLASLERLPALDRSAARGRTAARADHERWVRYGLVWDRLVQGLALVHGDVETFAQCSLRWQRTVATMLH